MAYGRRKKGGQRLMEMSRAGAKRKAAQRERTAKNFGVGAKNTVQPKKKAAPAKAAPKKKVAATKPATKPAAKKKVSSGPPPLPKEMAGRGGLEFKPLSELPGNILKVAGAFPVGKAIGTAGRLGTAAIRKALAPASGVAGGRLGAKAAGRTVKPSVQTPPKPSGPGSKTPKKPTGPGSRTTRKQTSTNKAADRTAKRKKRDERKERVAGGRKRVGQAKRRAGAARGRRTQRRQATLRGGGTVTY
jgi:hypothetical protein